MKGIARSVIGLLAALVAVSSATGQPPARQVSQGAPMVACFAEGTDPAYVEAVNAMVALRNQQLLGADYIVGARWSGTIGTPRTLTWSFVPDGLSIQGSNGEPTSGSTLFATFDAGYAAQGGRATWINRFQQVFDRWQALTGITYTRITSGANPWDDGAAWGSAGGATRGDIRISAHPIDGGSGVLAYNFFPSSGDMVLDSQDIGLFSGSSNANRFLRNVVSHEHGHGMGINHVCPAIATKLMEPFISTSYDTQRQDDIRAGQYLYGDDAEPNNTSGTATNLGTLIIGTPITLGTPPLPPAGSNDVNSSILSIGGTGATNEDWFRVTTTGAVLLTTTVTPVGSNYASYAQDANCSNNVANTNSLAVGNLQIHAFDTNGTTQLGTSNTAAAGVAEVLSGVNLPGAGTYFLKVSCSTLTGGQSQLYRLTVTGTSGNPCPSFTLQPQDSTVCLGASAQFTAQASGVPAPTLQWRRNGLDLSNTANISGVTTGTLLINEVGAGDAGDYDCVASNSCGNQTSTAATLTALGAPVITQQPQSQAVAVGAPVSFTVAVIGDASYNWRRNNVVIPGANNPTYEIASAQLGDAGLYDCQIFGICDLVTSDAATLTVTSGCYANCDNSTTPPILNVADFSCFLNRFAANDPYANCDNSTTPPVLNVADFSCFLNAFAAGCP